MHFFSPFLFVRTEVVSIAPYLIPFFFSPPETPTDFFFSLSSSQPPTPQYTRACQVKVGGVSNSENIKPEVLSFFSRAPDNCSVTFSSNNSVCKIYFALFVISKESLKPVQDRVLDFFLEVFSARFLLLQDSNEHLFASTLPPCLPKRAAASKTSV